MYFQRKEKKRKKGKYKPFLDIRKLQFSIEENEKKQKIKCEIK